MFSLMQISQNVFQKSRKIKQCRGGPTALYSQCCCHFRPLTFMSLYQGQVSTVFFFLKELTLPDTEASSFTKPNILCGCDSNYHTWPLAPGTAAGGNICSVPSVDLYCTNYAPLGPTVHLVGDPGPWTCLCLHQGVPMGWKSFPSLHSTIQNPLGKKSSGARP